MSYARLMVDLREHLLRDRQSWASTFMDYYGLPADFPGKVASQKYRSTADKSASLLAALSERLTADLGPEPLRRFIPYVQMHEFEGLLFSHPVALAQGLGQPKLADAFAKIRADFPTPEEINDSPESAPSKRLEQLSPGYTKQKAHLGLLAAHAMGLPAIRQSCGLFDAWLSRLESLGTQQP